MSYAARSVPPEREREAQDQERAELAGMREMVRELAKVPIARTSDRRFVTEMQRFDLARASALTRARIRRLAWKHRRALPRMLAPRANPDDPIVRAFDGAD
ncbi:MAG: hypothetical protein M0002_08215 [Rhodospirillales bacterium]|nr:hypothetical protein [Rhodospirillales bacterium]